MGWQQRLAERCSSAVGQNREVCQAQSSAMNIPVLLTCAMTPWLSVKTCTRTVRTAKPASTSAFGYKSQVSRKAKRTIVEMFTWYWFWSKAAAFCCLRAEVSRELSLADDVMWEVTRTPRVASWVPAVLHTQTSASNLTAFS